ncbi:hypothetical protein BU16DRAFT_598636 [Lophium mytilinum]|uniref:Uncharacterized protein n=1 Tax=Lophium mytilinum TaxID=390894 RepID=A0A6A6RBS4_9PEZI|nr:hypothetical protein BU16DRAFT_598636 [Lophium mytilinum]
MHHHSPLFLLGLLLSLFTTFVSTMSCSNDWSDEPFLLPSYGSHENRLALECTSREPPTHEPGPFDSLYVLWAYIATRLPTTVVHLRITVPALVTYVLGPTWRAQLAESGGRILKQPGGN